MIKKILLVSGDPHSINTEIIFKSWKKIKQNTKRKICLRSTKVKYVEGEGSKTTIIIMFDDKINMQVPHVHFRVREMGEWVDTNTDTYFKDKRVLVFSLPGAFTPTCSNQQLPGYELKADVFKEHGIDEIYCMSVNDSFVMNAWAQDQKLENVKMPEKIDFKSIFGDVTEG